MLINWAAKIMNRLRWKYFIGEYKPKEQPRLEKGYKLLGDTDKKTVREFRILLDTISENKTLKDELGVNPFELYSIGNDCFINFKDPSNPIMYKVHDLTSHKTLFNEDASGLKMDKIEKLLSEDLKNDQNYVKNFAKGYIIIDLPDKTDMKALNIDAEAKDLKFVSVSYDNKNNTIIIAVK